MSVTPAISTDVTTTGSPVEAAPRKGRRHETLYYALRSKKLIASCAIMIVIVLLAIFGPTVYNVDPTQFVGQSGESPSGQFPFGTELYGRDVLAQFLAGLAPTLLVGLLGGGIAAAIGMSIGFLAGYVGGIVDETLNILTNVVLVLPALVLIIVISSFLPPDRRNIWFEAAFVGLTSWPWVARAVRAQTFSLRTREFVDLAKLSGRPTWKIIVQEVAPNMSSYLFMAFILLFGGAILIAATLDFVGLGPTTGYSLGLIMYKAQTDAALWLGLWWWFVPPGLGITLIVASLYIMNVGLDEIFNPKLRES